MVKYVPIVMLLSLVPQITFACSMSALLEMNCGKFDLIAVAKNKRSYDVGIRSSDALTSAKPDAGCVWSDYTILPSSNIKILASALKNADAKELTNQLFALNELKIEACVVTVRSTKGTFAVAVPRDGKTTKTILDEIVLKHATEIQKKTQ